MELVIVLDSAPAVLVLATGLLVLIRRRAALGRRGPIVIAGTAVLLVSALADALLGIFACRAITARPWDLPEWIGVADLIVLFANLLGLPLLAWAVLDGRSHRSARVPA